MGLWRARISMVWFEGWFGAVELKGSLCISVSTSMKMSQYRSNADDLLIAASR